MAATPFDVTVRQLGDPKSSAGVYELPCGYLDANGELHREVAIREMTGAEEDLLASKSTPMNRKMNELLFRCVERVGNITDKGQIANAIMDMTMGDRFFVLFAIRRVTHGDLYPFMDKCPSCDTENLFQISIGDLDIKDMADPKRRIYEVTLPSGKVARVRVTTGRDEERMAKAAKSDDGMSLAILIRLETLDGNAVTLADVKKLGLRDRDFLRAQFEENEGGIDQSVEMLCPSCGHEFESELNIGQSGFFFPSATLKALKKKSST